VVPPRSVGRLAVIAPFYGRLDKTEAVLRRVLNESSRPPDELWVVCETVDDFLVASRAVLGAQGAHVELYPTPRDERGRPEVIPYSRAINFALDRTTADYIVYLDNGSMPDPDKYRLMVEALDEHPEYGMVYCGQERTGYQPQTAKAEAIHQDAHGLVNFTQVMHRRTGDRWPLDMGLADPDLADAEFWRSLSRSLGPMYPVASGTILDVHHMESAKALGV
jgi:Glycosyl transferase family 2